MSLLKLIFGRKSSEPVMRRLTHPRDLKAGDIVRFSHLPQPELSNAEFEVSIVNTYRYGQIDYPELVLKDRAGGIVYLMVEEEDGEEYCGISRKIPKAAMHELFTPEAVQQMMDAPRGEKIAPDAQDGFAEWMAKKYTKTEHEVLGAFIKGDTRTDAAGGQERFTSYIFEDKGGDYALELEYYDTGELELCVTVYHELSAIAEMWPGAE